MPFYTIDKYKLTWASTRTESLELRKPHRTAKTVGIGNAKIAGIGTLELQKPQNPLESEPLESEPLESEPLEPLESPMLTAERPFYDFTSFYNI